jgi:hypothetical protein
MDIHVNGQPEQEDATPPYVRRMLYISTTHVSEATAQLLDDGLQQWLGTAPFTAYTKTCHNDEYGWWVYVPSEPVGETKETFPADLRACMEHARSLDCDWIMFGDGAEIDALPIYD